MHQVTLALRFAGGPKIVGRDLHSGKRVVAEHTFVRADDLAVFERKRIEGSPELLLGKNQRRGDVRARPLGGVRRAGVQIVGGEAGDEREAREWRLSVAIELCAVRDHRFQSISKDAAPVGGKRLGGRLPIDGHTVILRARPRLCSWPQQSPACNPPPRQALRWPWPAITMSSTCFCVS